MTAGRGLPADPPVPAQVDRGDRAAGHRLGRSGAGRLPRARRVAGRQAPHHAAARRGSSLGGGHTVVATARARPADRRRRPGRLHLLRARPGPHPAAPPRHLRPRQHPVGRSPRRTAHPLTNGPTGATRCARNWPSTLTRPPSLTSSPPAWMRRGGAPRPGMPPMPTCVSKHRRGRDEIVLTPLDAEAEPASLVTLRSEVEQLLPEVEIADLPAGSARLDRVSRRIHPHQRHRADPRGRPASRRSRPCWSPNHATSA